ncbi:serine/threonine kinase [Pelomyxa schiedti]|nr:serine/threonine kinase [Pelomyxa schiedti]
MSERLQPYLTRKEEDPNEILRLDSVIAEGSFGTVYKGAHSITGEEMAIKIIQLEETETFDDLVIEIEVLSKCKHPNIAGYFGCWQRGNELFIGLELCEGGSTTDIYQTLHMPFSEPVISYICRETLKGLAYLHGMHFIHRDIKGANILFTKYGDIKLVDFGVSATVSDAVPKRKTFIGTPFWMAPEVIENRTGSFPYDAKADVWSLGITLIEFAELDPPLSDLHPMKALFQIPVRKAPTLRNTQQWSGEFNDIVTKCLDKDPKSRASVAQLLQHPFLNKAAEKNIILDLLDRYLALRAVEESEEDAAPASDDESDPPNLAQTTPSSLSPPSTPTQTHVPISQNNPAPPTSSRAQVVPPQSQTPPPSLSPSLPLTPTSTQPQQQTRSASSPPAPSDSSVPSNSSPKVLPTPPPKNTSANQMQPLDSTKSTSSTPLIQPEPSSPIPIPKKLWCSGRVPQRSGSGDVILPSPESSSGGIRTSVVIRGSVLDQLHANHNSHSDTQQLRSQPLTSQTALHDTTSSSPRVAVVPATKSTVPHRPAAQKRPETIHKTEAKRTLAQQQRGNRQIIKQQLMEIKKQQQEHLREKESLEARLAAETLRLTRVYTDKQQKLLKRFSQENEQSERKSQVELEKDDNKSKSELESFQKQQQATFKNWQKEYLVQQRVQLKEFQQKQEEVGKESNELYQIDSMKDSKTIKSKRLKKQAALEHKLLLSHMQEIEIFNLEREHETQRLSEEKTKQLEDREHLCTFICNQQASRHAIEMQTLVQIHQRKIQHLDELHARNLKSTTKQHANEQASLDSVHALLRDHLQQRLKLEWEQHKRLQEFEYRDAIKLFKLKAKKDKQAFEANLRDKLKQTPEPQRKQLRLSIPEKRAEYAKSQSGALEEFETGRRQQQESDDADVLRHRQMQMDRLTQENAEEQRLLQQKHKEALDSLNEAYNKERESMLATNFQEKITLLKKHQDDRYKLVTEQREAIYQFKTELLATEKQNMLQYQEKFLALTKSHHESKKQRMLEQHKAQLHVTGKSLKSQKLGEAAVAEQLSHLQEEQSQALQSQSSSHSSAIEMLLAANAKEIADLDQAQAKELETDKSVSTQMLSSLQRQSELELELKMSEKE